MIILGVDIGELSSVALMVDGEIVAAVHEERFTRAKNDEGYPREAIDYCLRTAGICGGDVDVVAMAGLYLAYATWVTRAYSTFSIKDHIRAQHEYWKPRILENREPVWLDIFKDKVDLDQYPKGLADLFGDKDSYDEAEDWDRLKVVVEGALVEHLGIDPACIVYVDHHTGHAAYAYWGSPFRDKKTLVITADAVGDGYSATINMAENGRISRVHSVPDSSFKLARLYRYVTLILGMKPNEHEYKVMGLAPYAKQEILADSYAIFKNTMYVDGLDFKWKDVPTDMYFWFRDKLEGHRFDGIAGGIQLYTEEILSEWIGNAIAHTGIGRVVYSGGVAMNVKANKVIHELDAVTDMYVCGSGGDESLAIGICYHVMEKECAEKGRPPSTIKPHSMYLGPDFDRVAVEQWIKDRDVAARYDVEYDVTPQKAARYLADGNVIGRMVGRMEFGQRALGNRSIIADPRRRGMIEKINRKIKNRDFWMPFAPSILAEEAHRYVVNPKGLSAPVMSLAFDSTVEARKEIPATLHPADHTMRPQVVSVEANPGYHALLSAFRDITGVGGVLNTSFNLHGEPIVCSPDDALHVFENSDIDIILFDAILVKKRS